MNKLIIVFGCFTSLYAHSWPDIIGGGNYRGAQGANDLIKQRYFCPLADLATCQPGHGIVLDATSQLACRTDLPTPLWGNGVAGQPLYVHWAGNGHTSAAQSGGTCVKIAITPYALEPAMSSLITLAECLPFSHDAELTDAYVTLPANLPSGKYTIWWLWNFPPFWFNGCGDINVVGATNSTPTTTIVSTTASGQTTVAPGPAATTVASLSATTTSASLSATTTAAPVSTSSSNTADCRNAPLPNAECQALYGASSYCVSWQLDSCGNARCFGAPQVTGCSGPTSIINGN